MAAAGTPAVGLRAGACAGGGRPRTPGDLSALVVSWIDDDGYPDQRRHRVRGGRGRRHGRLVGRRDADPDRSRAGRDRQPHPAAARHRLRRAPLPAALGPPVSGATVASASCPAGPGAGTRPRCRSSSTPSAPCRSRAATSALSEEKGRTIRPRLSPFWLALRTTRLPFLSATAVPVLLGIAVAASHGAFTWWTALLTLVGGSLAHLAINVTNDVFDTLSGADDANTTPTMFSGGSRVAVYDLVTVRGLAWLAMACSGPPPSSAWCSWR